MIGWYIGILGILIGMVGGFFFFKSLFNLEGDLRKSIIYLVIAALIYVSFSSMMIIFGILKYEITDVWWQVVPILYFISASFFVIGANKLVKLLQNITKNKKRYKK
jgi:hypothetical protein